MQIEFSAEQETRLADLASHQGVEADQMVRDAALRLLREQELFVEAVQRGIASADRGELLEPAVVWARMEELLRS